MIPGHLYHVSATIVCPHMGQLQVISTNSRVKVSGQPVATVADSYPITGCPFYRGDRASPCVTTQWLIPATRVFINSNAAVLKTSTGLCQSAEQVPQGPPNGMVTQVRVSGE